MFIDKNGLLQEEGEDDDITVELDDDINKLIDSNISCYTNGLQIESIINSLRSGYYIIPKFQRRFVWNKDQVAYLALSIIKNIPIPPLYFYVDRKKQVLLDGQQRATAMFLYFNGLYYTSNNSSDRKKIDFADAYALNSQLADCQSELEEQETRLGEKGCSRDEKKRLKETITRLKRDIKEITTQLKEKHGLAPTNFVIKGGNGEEKDISFEQFDQDSKEFLLRRRIDITIVESRDSKPQKTYANIFKLLNSGGKLLGAQEIRNGIYWESKLYEDLYYLNETNIIWRKIYGKLSAYSKDMEILLKILALNYYTVVKEERVVVQLDGTFSWSNIMESYSDISMGFTEEEEKGEIELLNQYFSMLKFGKNNRKCNKAVFEAVFVAVCKLDIVGDIDLDYNWVCGMEEQEEFEHVLSNRGSVETRLTKAYELVKERYYV